MNRIRKVVAREMVAFYADLVRQFPIVSIEDGLAENDWAGWKMLQAERAANSVLIKLNQIGTVSETVAAVQMARNAGWTAVVSHRSGETEDPFLSDASRRSWGMPRNLRGENHSGTEQAK